MVFTIALYSQLSQLNGSLLHGGSPIHRNRALPAASGQTPAIFSPAAALVPSFLYKSYKTGSKEPRWITVAMAQPLSLAL